MNVIGIVTGLLQVDFILLAVVWPNDFQDENWDRGIHSAPINLSRFAGENGYAKPIPARIPRSQSLKNKQQKGCFFPGLLWEFEPAKIEEARRSLERIGQQWDIALGRLKAFVEKS